jgi:xanthine phosphoribosyltransferase
MKLLEDRIQKEGKVLPGDIVKIDGFMNHRVDIRLMREMAKEFGRHFDLNGLTAVLTVEASGIALAAICADEFGVPMIFAKKAKSDNIEGGLYQSRIFSYTYKKEVTLIMSQQWLTADDKVLIVDDFMANGEALRGLVEIVKQSGAELIGIGIAVEKGFQPGGRKLREAGYDVCSLAIIEKADENGIVFRKEEE